MKDEAGDVRKVWVVGSGSLAQAVCHSLSMVVTEPTDVTVVARSEDAGRGICYVASTRARLQGSPVAFRAEIEPLAAAEPLAELAGRLAPDVVLNTASHQSPWERLSNPSAWTALTQTAGLGMTLPLQTVLAKRVAQALEWAAPTSRFLNASFPDAVNPVLRSLGLPIFAGIGNVGLIAATIQSKLGLRDQDSLQVLAHHWHLSTPEDGREACAWHGGRRVDGIAELLREQRSAPRHLLNPATGHTAALLLRDLTTATSFGANLPGPDGLPGGYPVQVEGSTISLRLPDELSRDEAVAWNEEFAVADGASLDAAGRVSFSPRVETALSSHLPSLARGFEVDAVDEAADDLLALRDTLRAQPIPSSGCPLSRPRP